MRDGCGIGFDGWGLLEGLWVPAWEVGLKSECTVGVCVSFGVGSHVGSSVGFGNGFFHLFGFGVWFWGSSIGSFVGFKVF